MAGHPPSEPDACGIALVAARRGRANRDVIERGLAALRRLALRPQPAAAASALGAGVLTAIPWDLVAPELPPALRDPSAPRIAAMFALDPAQADRAIVAARSALGRLGWHVMAWRAVPTALDVLDADARACAPRIVQCFARAARHRQKRTPYRTRLAIEARWLRLGLTRCSVTSLSDCTIVYKALCDPLALDRFFPDLADPRFVSAFAVVHYGFSSSTSQRWDLTQPFHAIAHAGEIRTIRGNRLWMDARIGDAGIRDESDLLKAGGSDSQTLDAGIQWQREIGLSMPHALSRLIPPAWTRDDDAAPEVQAFHRHESCFAEPWDGPSRIVFADGRYAGAMLDAASARPLHTSETCDLVCISSEGEALDHADSPETDHGLLAAGEMLIVDQEAGTVLRGPDVRRALAAQNDYADLTTRLLHRLARAPEQQRTGTVCLRTLLGRRGQWSAHGLPPVLLELDSPILLGHQLDALLEQGHVRAAVLPIGFEPTAATSADELRKALGSLQRTAAALAANGTRVLVLSDRQLQPGHVPIPTPLAAAAVDDGLRLARLRLRASIVADAGDVHGVDDIAMLASLGASAVVPYSMYATASAARCREALESGLRDILREAGVSSFESYCGARLFDPSGMDSAAASAECGGALMAETVSVRV